MSFLFARERLKELGLSEARKSCKYQILTFFSIQIEWQLQKIWVLSLVLWTNFTRSFMRIYIFLYDDVSVEGTLQVYGKLFYESFDIDNENREGCLLSYDLTQSIIIYRNDRFNNESKNCTNLTLNRAETWNHRWTQNRRAECTSLWPIRRCWNIFNYITLSIYLKKKELHNVLIRKAQFIIYNACIRYAIYYIRNICVKRCLYNL